MKTKERSLAGKMKRAVRIAHENRLRWRRQPRKWWQEDNRETAARLAQGHMEKVLAVLNFISRREPSHLAAWK
jgi:hypothetical protein